MFYVKDYNHHGERLHYGPFDTSGQAEDFRLNSGRVAPEATWVVQFDTRPENVRATWRVRRTK